MFPRSLAHSLISLISFIAIAPLTEAQINREDDFNDGLDPLLWNTPVDVGEGTLQANLGTLGFSTGAPSSLAGSNHVSSLSSPGLVRASNNWTANVTTFLGPLENFGTFDTFETVSLGLKVENSNDPNDSFSINFLAGLPFNVAGFGMGNFIRSLLTTDGMTSQQGVFDLLTNDADPSSLVEEVELQLSYNTFSGQVVSSYDAGEGFIPFALFDISDWNLNNAEDLTISLEASALNTQGTIQAPVNFSVPTGEAFFDDFRVTGAVPEPSSLTLLIFGVLSLFHRRR